MSGASSTTTSCSCKSFCNSNNTSSPHKQRAPLEALYYSTRPPAPLSLNSPHRSHAPNGNNQTDKPSSKSHSTKLVLKDLKSTLQKLKQDAQKLYNPIAHEELLKTIWKNYLPNMTFQNNSAQWIRIGFQQDDPSADLRGCGYLALYQLCQFSKVCPLHTLPHNNFVKLPLAAASFNVTHVLCTHLQLVPKQTKVQCCQPTTLAHFLRLTEEYNDAIHDMHTHLLLALARIWAGMQRPGLSPMHFPQAMKVCNTHLESALKKTKPPWKLRDMLGTK